MRSNKIVVIVGVGSELGIEIARRFGIANYDIVLMGRNMEKLEQYALDLKEWDIVAYSIHIDIRNIESIKRAFSKVYDLNQEIELLVYNAVARRVKMPSELQTEEVVEDFRVNVGGAIDCVGQVLEDFISRGRGSIIFTGGGVALSPSINSASMSISKAALRNYAFNLSSELKDRGVFVGIVTITQSIKIGTPFAPDIIAEKYFDFFTSQEETEIVI